MYCNPELPSLTGSFSPRSLTELGELFFILELLGPEPGTYGMERWCPFTELGPNLGVQSVLFGYLEYLYFPNEKDSQRIMKFLHAELSTTECLFIHIYSPHVLPPRRSPS